MDVVDLFTFVMDVVWFLDSYIIHVYTRALDRAEYEEG